MKFEITKEQVYEVAELYGLKVHEGDNRGILVDGEAIEIEEILKDFTVEEYEEPDYHTEIQLGATKTVNKQKNNLQFNEFETEFIAKEEGKQNNVYELGAA